MSAPPAQKPIQLRAAAVWGTTVLAVKYLDSGQSFLLGEPGEDSVPMPDGAPISSIPVRAVGRGWELDARGATGGVLHVRGRQEDPVHLARTGAPIPIVAGDHGLIQYGSYSLFFQFSDAPPLMRQRRRIDWPIVLAFLFSAIAVVGGLLLLWAITTPLPIPEPLELISPQELMVKFDLKTEPRPPARNGRDDSKKSKDIKDPGAKDKREMGGGRKIAGREGALRRQEKTRQTGETSNDLGGMAEALDSDVGKEVQQTLGTIGSVADALGDLRPDRIVRSRGPGKGLHGTGSSGAVGAGVPFSAGTLDTSRGPGRGGGLGRGSAAHGRGGNGIGASEHKVAGNNRARPGQGLAPAQISRVVNSRYGAFRACYEMAAARNPHLHGNVGVSWRITPGGSVTGASITGSSLSNPRVEGCILRMFRRLHFPVADKPTGASWTFAFRPGRR